jgi:hypothetical protein
MPLYYFHLRDGEDEVLDPEGRELENLEAVARAALLEARALIADEARGGLVPFDKYIDVQDVEGVVIHRLHFIDAVQIIWPHA